MNEKRKCLVGNDSDDGGCLGSIIGFMITIAIVIAVVMTIIAIMVFLGAIIGGFNSLKNYFIALKHNLIDSNRKPVPAN